MASYKKAAGRLHLLNKSRFQLDTKIAVTIYKSLIIPVLTYCTILSIFDNKSRAARLSSIDSRATRIANIQADQAHAVTLTPTASMKMKHACMFARKCIDRKLFEKFAEYFSLLSHENLPSVETEFSKRSVYFSRAKLYNELPVQIRQLDSFEIFPKSLNTFFYWDRSHWIIGFLILCNIELKVLRRSEMLLNFSMKTLCKNFFRWFGSLSFFGTFSAHLCSYRSTFVRLLLPLRLFLTQQGLVYLPMLANLWCYALLILVTCPLLCELVLEH